MEAALKQVERCPARVGADRSLDKGMRDAVLFLPQEGIAFMSDLLFVVYHP